MVSKCRMNTDPVSEPFQPFHRSPFTSDPAFGTGGPGVGDVQDTLGHSAGLHQIPSAGRRRRVSDEGRSSLREGRVGRTGRGEVFGDDARGSTPNGRGQRTERAELWKQGREDVFFAGVCLIVSQ